MNHRTLNNTLEARGGLGLLVVFELQIRQIIFNEFVKLAAQLLQIDIARPHHGGGVLIGRQRQKQVFEGGEFVTALGRQPDCAMEGFIKISAE